MGKNIAVIFGGRSNENEVSVITGTMAGNILKKGGNTVIPLYMSQRGELYTGEGLLDIENYKDDGFTKFPRAVVGKGGVYVLKKNKKIKKFLTVDVGINCCHGGWGEGGGVCGMFALNDIPLASAGLFESASFMDKYYTKRVLRSLGVKVAKYIYIREPNEFLKGEKLGYPVIVKPAKLGSSIGIECAENREELETAVAAAFLYDDGVILEKYIEDRREINCAVYYADGKVITSECEEAVTSNDILNFDDKYSGGGKSILPADIPEAISKKIKKITENVYTRLNMRGIVRFDFLLSGDTVYLSEINTVPGSLSYYLLSSGFKEFYPVLQAVITQAEEDFKNASTKTILKTGILNDVKSGNFKLNK